MREICFCVIFPSACFHSFVSFLNRFACFFITSVDPIQKSLYLSLKCRSNVLFYLTSFNYVSLGKVMCLLCIDKYNNDLQPLFYSISILFCFISQISSFSAFPFFDVLSFTVSHTHLPARSNTPMQTLSYMHAHTHTPFISLSLV